jgi:hypothetical protein
MRGAGHTLTDDRLRMVPKKTLSNWSFRHPLILPTIKISEISIDARKGRVCWRKCSKDARNGKSSCNINLSMQRPVPLPGTVSGKTRLERGSDLDHKAR